MKNNKKWILWIGVPLAVAAVLGLIVFLQVRLAGNRFSGQAKYVAYETSDEMMYDTAPAAYAMKSASGSENSASVLPANRKWVITMSINAETNDLDATLNALNDQIAAMSGYVESHRISNSSSYRTTRNASLTVRVPADRVDEFCAQVSGFTNVISSSRNVSDITLTYTDTEGRVNALKVEEQRLLELMEKAEKIGDLLEIESRLAEVRYRLENYSSQIRLYDNQVDYATVNLSISEVAQYTPVEKPGFLQRITDGLSESISDLCETAVDSTVWVIVNIPYLLLFAVLAWGAIAAVRFRNRKKKAAKAKKEAEKE